MGRALAALERWAQSWRGDTWVLVAWTLAVAGVYLWSQATLAGWCPDSVPDQGACRTRNFWAGPAFVLGPVAFFWLVYLIVWSMLRVWPLLRRPLPAQFIGNRRAYTFGCAVVAAVLFLALGLAVILLPASGSP